MVHSIIRGKRTTESKADYFVTFSRSQARDTIVTLAETGWVDLSERKIIRYDERIDRMLSDETASLLPMQELYLAMTYYRKQNTKNKKNRRK